MSNVIETAERIADLLFEMDIIGAIPSFYQTDADNDEAKSNMAAILVDALGKRGDCIENAMTAITGWVDLFYANDPDAMAAVRDGIVEIMTEGEASNE